jgi:hypothetical protein
MIFSPAMIFITYLAEIPMATTSQEFYMDDDATSLSATNKETVWVINPNKDSGEKGPERIDRANHYEITGSQSGLRCPLELKETPVKSKWGKESFGKSIKFCSPSD